MPHENKEKEDCKDWQYSIYGTKVKSTRMSLLPYFFVSDAAQKSEGESGKNVTFHQEFKFRKKWKKKKVGAWWKVNRNWRHNYWDYTKSDLSLLVSVRLKARNRESTQKVNTRLICTKNNCRNFVSRLPRLPAKKKEENCIAWVGAKEAKQTSLDWPCNKSNKNYKENKPLTGMGVEPNIV